MPSRIVAIAFAVLAASAGAAEAGRSHYGWLSASEVNPERGVEVETWIVELDGVGADRDDYTYLWWAPVVGVTDHVELAIPVELIGGGIGRYGAELRWRPDSPDELERGAWSAVGRLGVKRIVDDHTALHGEGGIVVAYERGRVHAEVDVATVVDDRDGSSPSVDLFAGGGASIRAIEDLRVGAEVLARVRLSEEADGERADWVAVGPNVGWTHGRFWASAALLAGVHQIDWAPRINMAVAF